MNGAKDISTFNLRLVINQWNIATDAGGGSYNESVRRSWTVWGSKQNRTGSQTNVEAQQQWYYNTVFKVRYNSSFKSNFTVDHGSERWLIDSIEIDNESYKEFMVLNCTRTDTNIDIS